ncbi:radical SAM protein [Pedobacter yulinensis]|uniref:Radical SAM protein n=1 Tax=Pedobacter yulinensis TaxID=2126353 RepID=A0A2T3HPP5_9SPHI|nr:radical SAM protein [Pedobacter yulinensis]PST84377.1 radical SAM protein [Pedobacter yulinensis]
MPERPYTYYDFTLSLCPHCLERIDAKIVFQDGNVYMHKTCREHGFMRVLIATDIEYYKNIRNYNKPSEVPLKFNTSTHYGCPYDCGLCADHEQHSCLTVVEITDRCNLSCPTCYAMSSPHYGRHRTLQEVERMFDLIVENEGKPDVVQISGGEPTIHPGFFAILDIAKQKPIKHLMVNTNGIRIAKDLEFTRKLATYMPDFEIYLQFDSFRPEVLMQMRGQDLTDTRLRALEHLNEVNLSTTLVVTLQQGLNDDEIGEIIDFALKQRCVRGVTFQPTQIAGRLENFDPATDRITMTDVRRKILEQSPIFQENDLIPVPCNPDALVMGYALKLAGEVFPMTRYVDPAHLLNNSRNTIVYEQDAALHEHMISIFSTGISVDRVQENINDLMCCLPQIEAPGLNYDNLFRIIIMRFIDGYDFDVRAIKKSCVHIVHKDGRIIPFETMNLLYRDDKESRLRELKQPSTFGL